jgi:hypothetical protein
VVEERDRAPAGEERLERIADAGELGGLVLLDVGGRAAREALAFASEGDFIVPQAEALMDLAEVLRLAGKSEAAEATVEEALRLYELKGNVLMAERAHALLEATPSG